MKGQRLLHGEAPKRSCCPSSTPALACFMMMQNLLRLVVFFIATGLMVSAVADRPTANAPVAKTPVARMPAKHRAFFKANCLQCHDAETQEGKVNLQDLSFDLNSLETAEAWQKVLGAINAGEMPPKGETQPDAASKTSFLEDLSKQMVVARKILSDSGGRITMRRLNRREYVNTVRDLLHVDIDAKDLPDDANSGGFDTAGGSLFFSSDQFEQYLKIGRQALDEAIITIDRPKKQIVKRESEVAATRAMRSRSNALKRKKDRVDAFRASEEENPGEKKPSDFGFIDAARVKFEEGQYKQNFSFFQWYVQQPAAKDGALLATSSLGTFVDTTAIPKDAPAGDYLLRVRLGKLKGAAPERCFVEYGRKIGGQAGEIEVLGCRQVTGTRADPQVIEIPVTITVSGSRDIGLRERQPNNRTAARSVYRTARAKNGVGPIPSLWVDWVQWEGPLVTQWPPSSHRQIFFGEPDTEFTDDYARQIVRRFATRAFRDKPPTRMFVDKLMLLFDQQRNAGVPFHEAIKEPLSVVLASPSFLYLGEKPDKRVEKKQLLSDLELAVRLSYFLWSGPPDEQLLELARNGQLNNAEELPRQVDRMLADPRFTEFISGFTHQWLDMERLDFFQFNHLLYRQFDESAKQAARKEIYETIAAVVREDDSLGNLLKSDFVVINDLLAQYYGIENVEGSEFRKVSVPAGSPRGGLLGTAAILAMGSDGERSSPVERGAWVLRKLLDDPPPPAPANVPQLSRLDGQLLSARELQSAHMEEPQCAQCHRKIDPIGFALENFDAIGRWREKEQTLITAGTRVKKQKKHAIDPSGTLPDGTQFDDFFQLRDRIAEREDAFARSFTKSLIEYGLGRPYGFSDFDLSQQILARANENDLSVRSFIHALILSKPFQRK